MNRNFKSSELIRYIKESKKKTPVQAYVALEADSREVRNRLVAECGGSFSWSKKFKHSSVFECGNTLVIFGDFEDVKAGLEDLPYVKKVRIDVKARNSALPLLDIKNINARIEPGAIIREKVEIGDHAVIMMGAVINVGATIGERTMIDMGAVLGGRAIVGADCHIGAGAVIAGVIEPESAVPTTIEDNVFIGANAVVIEGVRVGNGAVIGAGAVVTRDVPEGAVVTGVPGRVVRVKDREISEKLSLSSELREI